MKVHHKTNKQKQLVLKFTQKIITSIEFCLSLLKWLSKKKDRGREILVYVKKKFYTGCPKYYSLNDISI